jgi:hypothetical protein
MGNARHPCVPQGVDMYLPETNPNPRLPLRTAVMARNEHFEWLDAGRPEMEIDLSECKLAALSRYQPLPKLRN